MSLPTDEGGDDAGDAREARARRAASAPHGSAGAPVDRARCRSASRWRSRLSTTPKNAVDAPSWRSQKATEERQETRDCSAGSSSPSPPSWMPWSCSSSRSSWSPARRDGRPGQREGRDGGEGEWHARPRHRGLGADEAEDQGRDGGDEPDEPGHGAELGVGLDQLALVADDGRHQRALGHRVRPRRGRGPRRPAGTAGGCRAGTP